MYLLALNTTEGRLQMIIAGWPENETAKAHPCLEPLYAGLWHAPSQGAELLAPALQDACARLRIKVGEIGRIGVVRGPGGFTGLRLAIATASGLARANGALMGGMDFLPLLAGNAAMFAASGLRGKRRFFALTYARRNLLHMQGFVCNGQGPPAPLTNMVVLAPEEAAKAIAAMARSDRKKANAPISGAFANNCSETATERAFQINDTPFLGEALQSEAPGVVNMEVCNTFVFGSGLSRNREALARAFSCYTLPGLVLLPAVFDLPAPQALLGAALAAVYAKEDVTPLYARPSDAEENLESIAAGLGLDPGAARARFTALTEKI